MTLCNNPKHLVEGVEVPVLYMIKLSGAIFNLNVFLKEMPVRGKKKPINFLYYFLIMFLLFIGRLWYEAALSYAIEAPANTYALIRPPSSHNKWPQHFFSLQTAIKCDKAEEFMTIPQLIQDYVAANPITPDNKEWELDVVEYEMKEDEVTECFAKLSRQMNA
jgi:hypothetical protein